MDDANMALDVAGVAIDTVDMVKSVDKPVNNATIDHNDNKGSNDERKHKD
jgi:hypothetical protein